MLSFPEVLVILLVAVIVLGPKRLPEAARKIGHYVGLFRRIADSFKRELMTMDQTANRAINYATKDFDQVLPKETADLAEVLGISETPPVFSNDPPSDGASDAPPEALRPAPTHTAEAPASTPTGEQST